MGEWMDGWTDGWMQRGMDVRTGGRMEERKKKTKILAGCFHVF